MAYYKEYKNKLDNIIQKYRYAVENPELQGVNEYSIFNSMQTGITKHSLRYYQTDALFILDKLYQESLQEIKKRDTDNRYRIKPHINELLSEIEDRKKAPFIGYEMATGSGKTMLMGASIYFLNKKYGINNFLIITPSSTDIYQKTIRNFEIGNYESVWADDTPFTFNLITGDNYTQNLFYDSKKDVNIFVFNISKFGTNATNTGKTWESAIWQDPDGNNISIRQYLRDKKLVIITDEAHHAQSRTANGIIKNFHPLAVLEFTATAIENAAGNDRITQNIVYKYDIRKFLEDGHGKLVRALALASSERQRRGAFNENEKLKLITLLLVHLLKKEAVLLDPKCKGLKPISFVKVKENTAFTQNIFNYIKNGLSTDADNIKIILDKVKEQDLEITELIHNMYKTKYEGKLNLLQKDIQKVADTAIFYYGKSDKETEKKFINIRKNEVELVVYMQRLDEGIDLPNIYSMAVISDTDTDYKTSVKQIIGRGVRLNKENREFDDDLDKLKSNAEKLHVICDQGRNFDQIILQIQHEFGLNNKYFSSEEKQQDVKNHVKSDLLEDKYFPHIRADLKVREDASLVDLIKDIDTITNNFIENNCFEGKDDNVKRYLKYRPEGFFIEVDIFTDKVVFHEHIAGQPHILNLEIEHARAIYTIVQKHLHCLPDSDSTRTVFNDYIKKFNQLKLKYYHLSDADEKLVQNYFISSFSFFFRNHIEKNYYRLDYRQIRDDDKLSLKTRFDEYNINIPKNEIGNKTRKEDKSRDELLRLIEGQYHFYGYEKSIYDYDKFDSYTEYQFAEFINSVLLQEDDEQKVTFGVDEKSKQDSKVEDSTIPYKTKNESFWIKNNRNIYMTYGNRKYYPDFIIFKNEMIYVVETKGEIFSDSKKNQLLRKLNEVPGDGAVRGYKGLLIFSTQMDSYEYSADGFEEFIRQAEENIEEQYLAADLVMDPPQKEQYKKYIPAFNYDIAYKKFIKQTKTSKPKGWLEIPVNKDALPDNSFAVQVKGKGLYPKYNNNDWLILTHGKEIEVNSSMIALLKIEKNTHGLTPGYMLKRIELKTGKPDGEIFELKQIHIYEHFESDRSVIVKYDNQDTIVIIGTEHINE